MNILVEVANYLELAGIGTVGETVFVNEMPEGIDGVLLFTTGEGFEQHTNIGHYYRGAMFVSVRSKSAVDGEALAQDCFDALSFEGKALGSFNIRVSKPEALPQSFGRNDGGYIEWLLSFELHFTY